MSKRKTKHYPVEFKESSAKLAATSEESISQTAKALGVNPNTLYGWVGKYYPERTVTDVVKPDVVEENKRLRKENARLKQERDILKKATAYFAAEMH